jgi:hypothetical protein
MSPSSLTLIAGAVIGLAHLLRSDPEYMDIGTGTKIPTELDYERAYHYAMREICKGRNYEYKDTGICLHTANTCKAGPGRSSKPDEYGEWWDDKCIGVDLEFKKWCSGDGLTPVADKSGVYKCKTNKGYCDKKVVSWTGTDCKLPAGQWVSEQIIGTTITRGFRRVGEEIGEFAEDAGREIVGAAEDVGQFAVDTGREIGEFAEDASGVAEDAIDWAGGALNTVSNALCFGVFC